VFLAKRLQFRKGQKGARDSTFKTKFIIAFYSYKSIHIGHVIISQSNFHVSGADVTKK